VAGFPRGLSSPEAIMPITCDDLVAEARCNRSGPVDADALSPSNLREFLRFALGHLLEDLDYQADRESGGAIAARTLATLIMVADEMAAKAVQH
jgi:hypothetical protein